jgi:hypothetical protein
MKILVIDLEGTDLDQFLSDERMENVHQLIEIGGYGRLAGNKPEGFHVAVASDSGVFYGWDCLAEIGKKAFLIGQPFSLQFGMPNISWVSSFFGIEEIDHEIVASDDFSGALDGIAFSFLDKKSRKQNVSIEDFIATSQAQFSVTKAFLQSRTWDYLQLTDMGLAHLNQLRGDQKDETQRYLSNLDHEIGMLLQLLTDEVVLLILFHNAHNGNGLINAGDPKPGNSQFILASANNPLIGDLSDVRWEEIFPTLFELAGFTVGRPLSGTSLIASRAAEILARNDLAPDEAEIIRERLSGLGYIG